MPKETQTKKPTFKLADFVTGIVLTPLILKSIVITLLTFGVIYLIGLFNLASLFTAFSSVFVALVLVEEFQEGPKGLRHKALELGVLAAIISLIITFAKINLSSFMAIPVAQTLVVTFVVIVLYLLIMHPTKAEKDYANKAKSKYLTR